MSDHLFDPAEYGATVKETRRRDTADVEVVQVLPPWVVLRHLRKAPVAHVIEIDMPLKNDKGQLIADVSVRLAACGAFGMPMRDLAGPMAPACPRCFALRKRAVA